MRNEFIWEAKGQSLPPWRLRWFMPEAPPGAEAGPLSRPAARGRSPPSCFTSARLPRLGGGRRGGVSSSSASASLILFFFSFYPYRHSNKIQNHWPHTVLQGSGHFRFFQVLHLHGLNPSLVSGNTGSTDPQKAKMLKK